MASYGFNFRASSGYVTDPAGTTYAYAFNFATDTYPDAAISAALGINAGWYGTSGMSSFDISTGIDARLAGGQWLNAANQVNGFRADVAAGDVDVRCAIGFQTYATPGDYFEVFDNTTSRGVLVNDSDGHAGSNFYDATGTLRTTAAWPGSNAATRINVSSGIFIGKVGRGSGGDRTAIAHLYVEEVSGGATAAGFRSLLGVGK